MNEFARMKESLRRAEVEYTAASEKLKQIHGKLLRRLASLADLIDAQLFCLGKVEGALSAPRH